MGLVEITGAVIILALLHQVHGRIVKSGCDYFEGKWVFDDSYPLYDSSRCPFIEREFDCLGNGRPDELYLQYRWKPSTCFLPRFEGLELLERLRGKRVMFVGDSLSLNQWQSITCMIYSAAPDLNNTSVRYGDLSTFTFPEYDAKLMLSRNAFLVDIVSTSKGRILKLDSIESGKKWNDGMDVLIFNTWHWWLHTGRKQPWDWIEENGVLYKDMDRLVAYEKALKTWAEWVDANVDPARTMVFFQGVSPDHSNSSFWRDPKAKNCGAETKPLSPPYPGGAHPAELVVERVLRAMVKPVGLLNVTALSQLRKDGHPSVYGHGGHRDMDCSHWCLAGVPDTWNLVLYAELMHKNQKLGFIDLF